MRGQIAKILFRYLPTLFERIVAGIEAEFPPYQISDSNFQIEKDRVNIYLLGAGYTMSSAYSPNHVLSDAAKSRAFEAMRLFHQIPNSIIITSASATRGTIAQAQCTREALIALGLDSIRIEANVLPTDTESEAFTYVQLYGTDIPAILVTSALHQKRAVAWFKKVGVKTILSAPSDYLVFKDNPYTWKSFIPNFHQFLEWDDLVKEQLALFEVKFKD